MEELQGWIKSEKIARGAIQDGQLAVIVLGPSIMICSVVARLESDKIVCALNTNEKVTIPEAALHTLWVEFMDSDLKRLPLKYSQWPSAVYAKEVNSGKQITFIIKDQGGKMLARVISKKINISEDVYSQKLFDAYTKGAEDEAIGKASVNSWEKWFYEHGKI